MATYRTRDGDMLDAICLSYYGQADGYLESVLTANPSLQNLIHPPVTTVVLC
jgi:phage tail protein X